MEQEIKLLIVLWTFFGLSTATVGLRCYVRLAIAKSFGIDDWFMIIGYVSCSALVRYVVYELVANICALGSLCVSRRCTCCLDSLWTW
jgi:hypothetical protein